MDPIKVDFTGGGSSGKGKGSGKDAYLAPDKAGLKTVISIIGTVIGAAIAYYFMLPPLNFKSTELYMYLGVVAAIYAVFQAVLSGMIFKPEYTSYFKKKAKANDIKVSDCAINLKTEIEKVREQIQNIE